MTCCAPSEFTDLASRTASGPDAAEIALVSRRLPDGQSHTDLSVPGIHCGACIANIETALGRVPGIESARVNLSARRVAITWRDTEAVRQAMRAIDRLGYRAHLLDPQSTNTDHEFWRLVRALAVAAFAAMNIMTLSVGVWSGADAAMRDLLHTISGLIALPALLYSGRIFYLSAWSALRAGTTNMDVPITIGIVLAFGLSAYDTLNSAHHAYFDAVTSLLFFLLVGRTLDHMMRERARKTVRGLERLAARGALVVGDDGAAVYTPIDDIRPTMRVLLAAGDRVPVDGRIVEGTTDIDMSLVNGESLPIAAAPGTELVAGTLNLTGPIALEATAEARNSFLAEMIRLIDSAEAGRGHYRRIADRVSRFYAPFVHLAALFSLAGWVLATGDVHHAITIAIAVLIITCPCALGLAVPMVHVVAAQRLFSKGIMSRDGTALEQLAEIDTVVFDKTGTLTTDRLALEPTSAISSDNLAIAAGLALHSRHPVSTAILAEAERVGAAPSRLEEVREYPGLGMEGNFAGKPCRLGRSEWAAAHVSPGQTILAVGGVCAETFVLRDTLREDARQAIDALNAAGLDVEILSGDTAHAVGSTASQLGITTARSGYRPAEKLSRLEALAAGNRKSLMVGDGLNDTPAMAAALVSMTPANASDVGRAKAGFVFLNDSLLAVPQAIAIARQAAQLVRQNFVISIVYNVIALPLAVLGLVTPLVAALAMSLSSIVVVANALRLSAEPTKKMS